MKNSYSKLNRVEIYIGGCTGSFNSPAERIEIDDTKIIQHPLLRGEFGAHTTSIGILMGETGVIVDNGSGVPQVVEFLRMKGVKSVYILNTHYHIDHIVGLPMNSFLLRKDGIVKGMYGPELGAHTFASVIKTFYAEPFWPINPTTFGITLPMNSFKPGDTIPVLGGIKTMMLNHGGGAVAYRIPTVAGDIVITTDNELSNDDIRERTAQFISGAKIVYIDVQYRDEEYRGNRVIGSGNTLAARKTYGHSTPSMVKQTYERIVTAPEITLVGHHDPKRSNDDLFAFEKEMQRSVEHLGTKLYFARECKIITLESSVPPRVERVGRATELVA